ncbi:hypothetical protein D2E25_0271 [Bifidobacterium goeldii]|uniref:Uncharacterized protein n=1 Tax=Bifidobacterium goeldii TaxID=2306975 RepID=A0A430FM17_9BIFI|nr:hypothetical protein [Bifidobacterium goeldii]RSX53965.1 hypothetical protein D2E25_0271 [Bifidobacterium goeldii]
MMQSTTQALDALNTPPAATNDGPSLEHRLFLQQAQRIAIIDNQIKELQEERESIKQQILVSHPTPGTYEAGALTVTVKNGARRLDARKLEKAYPADKYPQLYKNALDTKMVRQQFAPAALEAYQTASSPTVVVA